MAHRPFVLPWYVNPWSLMLAAVVVAFAGLALSVFPGPISTPVRAGLLTTALIMCGLAASWRLRRGLSDFFDERLEPAALLAAAAGVALIVACATDVGNPQIPLYRINEAGFREYNPNYDPGWDSIRLLLNVMTGVALAGGLLALFPWNVRKILIVALTLFHFLGILTASSSAPTSSGSYPWLPSQIWNRVYRPYLCFMYLNNAYHFYSPEPGPATVLWFRVEFDDAEGAAPWMAAGVGGVLDVAPGARAGHGSARWLRIAEREDSTTRLEYQRLLALTEQVNQPEPDPQKAARLLEARQLAGATHDPPIPLAQYLDVSLQYRELSPLAKKYIASYARHVALNTHHATNPNAKVKYVRVYRVTHQILAPGDLAQGADPCDPTHYWVWYNGEYTILHRPKDAADPAGEQETVARLRDHRTVPQWENLEQDPFLYWYLPIFRRPKNADDPTGGQEIVDCLARHAGDSAMPEWENWPVPYHRWPEGTFVSGKGGKEFVMKGKDKQDRRYTLSDDAKVIGVDGKECKLADFNQGQKIRATIMSDGLRTSEVRGIKEKIDNK